MKNRYLAFFFLILLLSSCEKETILRLSESEIVIDNSMLEYTVELTSNVSWKSSKSHLWYSLNHVRGTNSTSIKITASMNADGVERTSTLKFIEDIEGGISVDLKIIQPASYLTISKDTLFFAKDGETLDLSISSDVMWTTNISSDYSSWLSVSETTGGPADNKQISVISTTNTLRKNRMGVVEFKYGDSNNTYTKELVVVVAPQDNIAPDKPVLIAPENNSTDIFLLPKFSWNGNDPDGDELSYKVCYSKDQITWDTLRPNLSTSFEATLLFDSDQLYYWKVLADDQNGRENSKTYSDVYSFTTKDIEVYVNKEYVKVYSSTKSHPSTLIFTGDAYISADYIKDFGDFDSHMDEAIEAFFSIEPYKSYKEYFNVYKLAAYSPTRNIGQTIFRTEYTGGTGISCDYNTVFSYVDAIPDIDLTKAHIVMAINDNKYAGTCISWADGKSIGMIPVNRTTVGTPFANIVMHESGGHGFGRLADEYVNEYAYITEADRAKLLLWQGFGTSKNVDITSSLVAILWSRFIGVSGYERVGAFEGGYYYSKGVWRPEATSCMIDNRAYYNAQSRYLIVERIMSIAGEEFTFEEFKEKDLVKSPPAPLLINTKTEAEHIPLGRSILIR